MQGMEAKALIHPLNGVVNGPRCWQTQRKDNPLLAKLCFFLLVFGVTSKQHKGINQTFILKCWFSFVEPQQIC